MLKNLKIKSQILLSLLLTAAVAGAAAGIAVSGILDPFLNAAVIIVGIIIIILLGLFINGNISKPLGLLTEKVNKIALGGYRS